ncbi:MAG: glycosyltransferase family 4 protein [Chloroflexi bacterium]|nr:glycosyltransferase family 4 protein [Chloroflexota bacterium]
MKILHLSTHDIRGGAARAAYRLHQGLQAIGEDSSMLVQRKHGDDPTVSLDKRPLGRVASLLTPHVDKLPLAFYPKRQPMPWGLNWTPSPTATWANHAQPDIVQLHWIADGFVPLHAFAKIKAPLVWTLHDSWAFTGGCHLPYECFRYRQSCGACPQLKSTQEHDLSRWLWQAKDKALRDRRVTIVTPSRWLATCAQSSSLMRDCRVEVIPNGLDLTRFKPVDKKFARAALGLPSDKKLILFGALNSTSDRNKGFHLLAPALQSIAASALGNETELVIFGAPRPAQPPALGLPAHYPGRLQDEVSVALLYAAADLFVAPSIQENLSNMVMEALACGTPCVAFQIGGMPDMIDHQQNGYLARPFESDDLAAGISWVLGDEMRWQQLTVAARRKVEENFELQHVARRYTSLYEELMH